jgi:hypothetical protein
MSSTPSLPVEILDRIFYFLRDDIPALQSSANVSRNFADIVERHLYYHITLDGSETTAAQLSKLLVVSPHIIAHVKSLRIILASKGFYYWLVSRSFKIEEEFASILPRLLHLTTVCLHAEMGRGIQWQTIRPKFQSAFVACIQSPTVLDVSVSGVHRFPLSLLEDSLQIEWLSLRGDFSRGRPSSEQNVAPYPRLRGLTIETCPELVAWLQNINVTNISSLTIWIDKLGGVDWLRGFLTNCSKSLTYLELNSPFLGPRTHCFVFIFPITDLTSQQPL